MRADQSLTSAVRGDGGVYSSLRDYRKWLAAIDERKLLSKASYEAMFSPQVKTDRDGSHYGYGWFIDEYRGETAHPSQRRHARLSALRAAVSQTASRHVHPAQLARSKATK